MSARFDWTLTERATGDELNVSLGYVYHAGERAIRSGHPDRWTPGEPTDVEILDVLVEGETVAITLDAACKRFDFDESAMRTRILEAVESGDCDDREPDYEPDYERDEDYREGSFNGY